MKIKYIVISICLFPIDPTLLYFSQIKTIYNEIIEWNELQIYISDKKNIYIHIMKCSKNYIKH